MARKKGHGLSCLGLPGNPGVGKPFSHSQWRSATERIAQTIMSSKKNRLLVLAMVAAALVVLGHFAYQGFRQPTGPQAPVSPGARPASSAGGPAGAPAVPVEVAKVVATELLAEATAVGSLRSNESVVLRPEIAGRIAAINFRDGVAVARGTRLVALDAATQTAEFEQAKANLDLARANHQRSEDLFARKFISQQAVDNARAALKVQEAALSLAQARLDKTRILAPFAGIVGIRNVSVGDYVKEGQELVNLEDIATLKIDFRLPESYLTQLRVGQQVEVSTDALPGQVFRAVLEAINPLVDAAGRAISLRARLPNDEARLRPGMFVRVRLLFGRRGNVLLIPEQAVVPDRTAPYVYRVLADKAQRTPIQTGLRREAQVEVVAGLQAGDEVVTAGHLRLRDGAAVRRAGETAGSPPPPAPGSEKTGPAGAGASR